MEIDVRKLIINTLYTVMNNSDRRIISWDDIVIYITLLEEKLGKQIKFVYDNNFNEVQYENFITCNAKNNNVYFTLNPKYHIQQIYNIIDNKLLLDTKHCQPLINRNIDDDKADELVVLNRNQHNKHYQKQISLDKILKSRPIITYIKFDGLFKMFMLYYSLIYKNNIKKEILQESIDEISTVLKSKYIFVQSMSNSVLLETACDNPNRKFNLTDDEVKINIVDLKNYLSEITGLFDKKTLKFIKQLIAYYVTTPQFENKIFYDEIFEKQKGI